MFLEQPRVMTLILFIGLEMGKMLLVQFTPFSCVIYSPPTGGLYHSFAIARVIGCYSITVFNIPLNDYLMTSLRKEGIHKFFLIKNLYIIQTFAYTYIPHRYIKLIGYPDYNTTFSSSIKFSKC